MSGGSSVYSPLPQSNSDSDEFSEEELHSSNERQKVISRISKLQKQAKPEIILNGKKPKVTNYKQLDNDRDLGVTLNGFQLGADEITILKPTNKIEKFSTSRKICFTFSIFLCVFTTIVFLWILPCEIGSCPPAVVNSLKKILYDIELHGPIGIVPNERDKSNNLVFLFRKSFKETENSRNPTEGSGVISLLGVSKEVSWWVFLEREPKDIDCNVIDVDLDGLNDCLVVGRNNLLKAIESLPGKELWDVHGNELLNSKTCDFSFPVVLPDLDGDNVSDLLSICSVGVRTGVVSGSQNYFVLISGGTGTVMGNPTKISPCYSIRNLMIDKGYLLSYTCLDPTNKESVNTLSLRDFLQKINVSFLQKLRLNRTDSQRSQHKNNDEENLFYVEGRRLSLENKGLCPEKCSMIVTVKDERNGRNNQTLWVKQISNSYGMIPVVMKFEKLTGFVFKYWKWESQKNGEEFSGTFNGKNDSLGEGDKSRSRQKNSNETKSLEYEMFQGDFPETARYKRMLTKRFSNGVKNFDEAIFKKENFTFHKIIERVVLITFNETDMQTINASQTEIIQICRNIGNCQPDAHFQRQSLLITDTDNDSFQDLVSYSSSFVNRLEQESTSNDVMWQLQSTVQVIKLETELPKLYKSKN